MNRTNVYRIAAGALVIAGASSCPLLAVAAEILNLECRSPNEAYIVGQPRVLFWIDFDKQAITSALLDTTGPRQGDYQAVTTMPVVITPGSFQFSYNNGCPAQSINRMTGAYSYACGGHAYLDNCEKSDHPPPVGKF